MMIKTPRLLLRAWQDSDRDMFVALHANPDVMADVGGPLDQRECNAKLDRYRVAFDRHGFFRWVIEDLAGKFVGYAGVLRSGSDHPLGVHDDLGYRLASNAWGQGYATEAAKAALEDVFTRIGLREVLVYTSPDNTRSRSVIKRLGAERDSSRDFTVQFRGKE